MSFKEGDYFYSTDADDKGSPTFSIFRCLKIDTEFNVAHVSLFDPLNNAPGPNDIGKLKIRAAHLPIDLDGFDEPVVFAQKPVSKSELEGYYAYLKDADFLAWAEETGVDVEKLAAEAEKLFDKATKLADKGQYEEAAQLYYDCYEMFPVYFEALDNAGLCLLDAEQYEDAIGCFEESINVNDHTFMTDFSIAQCYHAMDDMENAEEWYRKARALPGITKEQSDAIQEVLIDG